jgi:hypothetical protein
VELATFTVEALWELAKVSKAADLQINRTIYVDAYANTFARLSGAGAEKYEQGLAKLQAPPLSELVERRVPSVVDGGMPERVKFVSELSTRAALNALEKAKELGPDWLARFRAQYPSVEERQTAVRRGF